MKASMAVALDSSPASSGRQPGILATIVADRAHRRRVVAADQHVGVDRLAEVAELLGRQVVQRGHDVAAGHGGLHVGGHAAARRDERLELVTDPYEGVGHADHDLALQGARACSWAVVAAESHGVAMTTRSQSAAAMLSP